MMPSSWQVCWVFLFCHLDPCKWTGHGTYCNHPFYRTCPHMIDLEIYISKDQCPQNSLWSWDGLHRDRKKKALLVWIVWHKQLQLLPLSFFFLFWSIGAGAFWSRFSCAKPWQHLPPLPAAESGTSLDSSISEINLSLRAWELRCIGVHAGMMLQGVFIIIQT